MPRHVHDAVQASISRYRGRRWRRDWCSSEFLFDAKDRYGECLLTNILFPILATDAMALDLPVDYQEAGHPLRTTHRSLNSGIDLVSFFGGAPRFPESHTDPLIQLVDVIGWIAQRHLRFPDDDDALNAYRNLRRRQFSTDIWRFRFLPVVPLVRPTSEVTHTCSERRRLGVASRSEGRAGTSIGSV
jgi:hypothetical protein